MDLTRIRNLAKSSPDNPLVHKFGLCLNLIADEMERLEATGKAQADRCDALERKVAELEATGKAQADRCDALERKVAELEATGKAQALPEGVQKSPRNTRG